MLSLALRLGSWTLCLDLDRDTDEDDEESDAVVFHGEPSATDVETLRHSVR